MQPQRSMTKAIDIRAQQAATALHLGMQLSSELFDSDLFAQFSVSRYYFWLTQLNLPI